MNKHYFKSHILVVDDEAIIKELLKSFLTQNGYKVSTANNGLEALHILAKQDCDMVLMDISMPIMDGLDATIFLRKCEQGKHVSLLEHQELAQALSRRRKETRLPVVALTGNLGSRKIVLKAGLDEYIAKPYELDDIRKMLNKYCRDSKQNFQHEKRKHTRYAINDFILLSNGNTGEVVDISAGGLAIKYAEHDLVPDEWFGTFINQTKNISIPDIPFKLAHKSTIELSSESEARAQTIGAMFNNPSAFQQGWINQIIHECQI